MRDIYAHLMAAEFVVPRTIRAASGAAARHLHLFSDVPDGAAKERAFARAISCVRHPAVPTVMTETAYRVAHSGFNFGPEKKGMPGFCRRLECPCNQGYAETVEHTFWKCGRSYRLWSMLFEQWREVTGEVKVTADLGRIVIFGDRSGTWADEAQEGEWAGLEEPFAIMHKAALHELYTERERDTQQNPKPRHTAMQIYQHVQAKVQRIVENLWALALARRRSDQGASLAQLRKRWEAPGLAVIAPDDSKITVVLFFKAAARARWRRPASGARDFRAQQYAPPDPLPADTIEIYTAGAADTRKKGFPDPPGGFGFAAYAQRTTRMYEVGGQITMTTPNVKTITRNLAELIAFTRALQWAHGNALAQGRPICIRYSFEFAARISTGAWKARKHKQVADEARRAWKALKQARGQVWIRHARAGAARDLAVRGQQGERIERIPAIVVD